MQKYPEKLVKAVLIKRINRFVASVSLNNEKINVYVPNTGRLSELALPGTEVFLSPIEAKYKYKILYIINRAYPVMIDSTYSNRLFLKLLRNKKVPGLENYSLIKTEPVYGNHRFDFLLSRDEEHIFVELKSCTLFHGKTGAFPDAVSVRASEHVKALSETGKGKLIFLVLKNNIEKFIPNYHTDFIFYETLKKNKNSISIHAYTVHYDKHLEIQSLREIPVVIPDVKPVGIFLLLLFNQEDRIFGEENLKRGWYLYCGESNENIFKSAGAARRKNGIRKLIPDERFSTMKIVADIPFVTCSISAEDAAGRLIKGSEFEVSIFPYNKCCSSPLLYCSINPAETQWFWDIIFEMRFGILP